MIFKKLWEYIGKSIFTGISNKVSTTRISSYLILGSILTTGLVYLLIDIVNAIILWNKGKIFILSTESIVFFGMVLTHHLALLGINKNAETKQYLDLLKSTKENELKMQNNTTTRKSTKKTKKSNEDNQSDSSSTGTGTEEDSI